MVSDLVNKDKGMHVFRSSARDLGVKLWSQFPLHGEMCAGILPALLVAFRL